MLRRSVLPAITALMWMTFLSLVFFYLRSDARQGVIQRIFYFHVPTAWVSFIAFTVTAWYSVRYLRSRDNRHDTIASAHALTGWIFTTGVLVTGPLWAKPIWGDFWNWSDQRLVSFFVLWVAYGGYLALRNSVSDPDRRARLSAVLGILAYLNVPLVYLAIRIWNTPSHPGPVVGGQGNSGVDPQMRIVFWFGVICFTLAYLLLARIVVKFRVQNSEIRQRMQREMIG